MALRWWGFALMGMAATGVKAVDLGTYNGCAATDAQFTTKVLYSGPVPSGSQEPHSNAVLKTAFAKQADGTVDVYFIQKQGPVKRYNAKGGTVDELGTLNVDYAQNEYGLIGIATRKDFLQNPYLFLYYSFKESDNSLSMRITRIKLTADMSKLDMASEKILIKFTRQSVTWHTGGGMQFDDYGDLWVSLGDNQQTDQGPGNTADLRGSIIRIHPDESAKGYSIPDGNFAAFFQAYYTSKGQPDVAAKYADTTIVKPQIYVKGVRNPYTLTLDPVRRWVTWGDVGPDQGKVSEEYNLVKQPVFTGWPYYAGEEDMTGISAYGNAGAIKTGSTKAAPVNGAGLGIKSLPPVTDPIFARNQACAMSGPIFRYDGTLTNPGQMPPQLNRKWLITGCDGWGWHLMTLAADGSSLTSSGQGTVIWGTLSPRPSTVVDAKQGPDGSLYYVDYGKGTVNRIDYTGTCKDPALVPEQVSSIPAVRTPSRAEWLAFDRRSVSVSAPGPHRIEIVTLEGRVKATLSAAGPATHGLPELPAAGVYHLRVRSAAGEVVAALPWIGR